MQTVDIDKGKGKGITLI